MRKVTIIVLLLFLSGCAAQQRQEPSGPAEIAHGDIRSAILFSGGGALGAFSDGVAKAVSELQLEFDAAAGISAGALVVAPFVQGDTAVSETIWKSLQSERDVFHTGNQLLHALVNGSLYDTEPLENLIEDVVDVRKLRHSPIRMLIGVVCLETGRFHLVDQASPRIKRYILASCIIPGIMAPVRIDGYHYVDGGLRYVLPVRSILRAFPSIEKIVLVSNVRPDRMVIPTRKADQEGFEAGEFGFIESVTRAAEIVSHHHLAIEVEYAEASGLDVTLIQPDGGNCAYGILDFNQEDIRACYEHGYRKALEVLNSN
jgi:predicted acylesterase/phospholipase RssA